VASRSSRAEWLDLHKLRVFLAVAEYEHVSQAAKSLRISQPAVSAHIRDLERHFGVSLFDRLSRGVRLRPAGHVVQAYATRLIQISLELEEAVGKTTGLEPRHVTVGAGTTPGTYLLPPVLATLRERLAGVSVKVEIANTATIAARLHDGSLHLGVLGEPVHDDELELEPWLEDELVLVLPPGHRWSGRAIELHELSEESLIAREPGSATAEVMRRTLEAAGLIVTPRMVLGSTEAVKCAVAEGLGVAFLSSAAIEHEVSERRLSFSVVRGLEMTRRFQIARRRGRRLSPAEELVRSILRETPGSVPRLGHPSMASRHGNRRPP
jgi:DNA-binding transcriptional LysR family regulator